MKKHPEKCQVCGAIGFKFLRKTHYSYQVWGCKNGHAQEVRTHIPSHPFAGIYGVPV